MASGLAVPEESNASLVVCCAPRDDRIVPLLAALKVYSPVHIELNTAAQADFGRTERDKVAVVSFCNVAFLDSALCAIHELRKLHFNVIGWLPGANRWPVALRARVLIAGAETVIDSEESDAGERLRQHVARCLRDQAAYRNGRDGIVSRMRDAGIVGDSPQMLALFRNVIRISRLCDVPVLIHGETGTGKELVARAIHSLDGKRRAHPFLPLNCAALSSGIAESELFGHRRGAFTGADRDRRGLIRSAEGGVLFLDEIGELDFGLQAKLLRVLQEGRVLGVGEDRESQFDVRIIAATNRSLPDMVAGGTFRADLYHRLSVISLVLPPLRERRSDLPALVGHFVHKHQALGVSTSIEVSPDFLEAVNELHLPGNARQLENLVRYALLAKTDSDPLGICDLPQEVWRELAGRGGEEPQSISVPVFRPLNTASLAANLLQLCSTQKRDLPHLLQEIERLVLKETIEKLQGDLTKAAIVLGLKPRTLYNKRQKHHLAA
jgi:transcriptional regulator with GAF, ATPase, and Fis domain